MKQSLLLLAGLLLLQLTAGAQSHADFRVVGYMRNRAGLADEVKRFKLEKITHLNIAFANPDSTGKLVVAPALKAVTAVAHKSGVKVLLSIGGGMPPPYLRNFLYGAKQDVLIDALVKTAVNTRLDGIDVDLEGGLIDENYEAFVTRLASALKAKNKLITSAIATVYADRYTDKALAAFDFINVMCYDKTGPWRPEIPGQHAPYDMAVEDMGYWNGKRGIAAQRLNLGIPFYGYGFGTNAPESLAYRDIIARYPGAQKADEVAVDGGGTIYYNGEQTIKNKAALALKTAGGIMIWQLLQDAEGDRSLLELVHKAIQAGR